MDLNMFADLLDAAEEAAPLSTWSREDLEERCKTLQEIFGSLCFGIALCHTDHRCIMCDMSKEGTPLAKMVAIEAIRESRRRDAEDQKEERNLENDDN